MDVRAGVVEEQLKSERSVIMRSGASEKFRRALEAL